MKEIERCHVHGLQCHSNFEKLEGIISLFSRLSYSKVINCFYYSTLCMKNVGGRDLNLSI